MQTVEASRHDELERQVELCVMIAGLGFGPEVMRLALERKGIARPAGFPFNLNSAVDALLKTEFDEFRKKGEPHPLMAKAGINAVPHAHPELETWRSNFKGVRTLHERTNLELFGAIDDLWRDLRSGELIVADYKSTYCTTANS